MKYYKFWCEWDIGINDEIYASYEVAVKHISQALEDCFADNDDDMDYSIEGLEDEGLLGIEEHYMVME